MTQSFPRLYARTRRFTLGVARDFTVSADGSRVVFLRSVSGTNPSTCLWTFDVTSGEEELIVDPGTLDLSAEHEPREERARRERAREQAGGIVAYATDDAAWVAAFALGGRLYLTDLTEGTVRRLGTPHPAVEPRPDPSGRYVAYVHKGALHVLDVATAADAVLATPEHDRVCYGLAEFIAAEEMGRMRGYWWCPDGERLLVARVDDSQVRRWHLADPASPDTVPTVVHYPAAGTQNAEVSLSVRGLDGSQTPVHWDNTAFPYLVNAVWARHGLLLVVQTRDQRTIRILGVDPDSGVTRLVREDADPQWMEIVSGVPAYTGNGALVWVADADGARRLLVNGEPVTPPTTNVRAVLDVDEDTVLFTASTEPTEVHLWTYGPAGLTRLTREPGVYGGRRRGGTTVITAKTLASDGTHVAVHPTGEPSRPIPCYAERPGLDVRVDLVRGGQRQLRTAVLLPSWHQAGTGRLPVLMDPYGGPHAQRVLAARSSFLEAQWFAEQGFAVVVADGRGTPGRGSAWERAVHGDLATPVLEDQVEALHAAAARHSDLDLNRVAIRGWSFGGYLAALAVLRRPDVFHAAIAGAPVTDWRLYDTHYTERYLGHPEQNRAAYERSSLLADAEKLRRPLLLIHGLADDNVVAAHTLRLSAALLAAGRPHTVLPLPGITHMTPQETVAENLLLLQLDFIKTAFGMTRTIG